jgi:ribonuclease-3
MKPDFKKLAKQLGIHFNDLTLLKMALTHKSANKNHNERLEFLGDSILSFVITSELYEKNSHLREGDLSRLRSSLVRGTTLAELSGQLGLGDYLILGSGELKSGGFRRLSILEDTLEALFGAYYLDQGFDACRDFILRIFKNHLANPPELESLKDPKTRLQEYLQAQKIELPVYDVIKTEGKAHNQKFTVRCVVATLNISKTAMAASRKKAEQIAALDVFKKVSK